ncbi:MAG TPA: transcription-repair coupling factor [Actinobacteria bacterium]|nr:transcription-repair coupling factor [Actinomycetota bacterium]
MAAPLSALVARWGRDRLPDPTGRLVVPPAARALLLAGLLRRVDGPVLAVVAGEREAEELVDDLELFTDDVVHLPAWETLPFEHVSPNRATMARRARARHVLASGRPVVVVASARAAAQRLAPQPPPPIELTAGERFPLDLLVERLAAAGYERTHRVEGRGEFAVRGGIVDVFPGTDDEPVRVDFWDDEIEELRRFAVASQRSGERLARVEIHAVRELVVDEAIRRRAESLLAAEPWAADTWERISQGQTFPGIESWLPWLVPERRIVDDAPFLVVFDRARIEGRIAELAKEEADLAAALATTWGERAPVADQPRLFLDLELDDLVHLDAPAVPSHPGEERLEIRGLDAVPGDPGSVAAAVNRWRKRGVAVVVAMDGRPAAERVSRLLAEHGADLPIVEEVVDPVPQILGRGIHRGFVAPELGFGVVGEREVAGRRRAHRRPRRRRDAEGTAYRDLRPGDYVVHEHHGIGRFEGLVRRAMGGADREYLLIEYAGGDRLYVPTDQLAAVRRYTGGEAPRLSRMGGGDWAQTRAKVRKAVAVVAEEVVALHRRRAAARGHAFSPDTPWQREFEAAFPYEETPDQLAAIAAVKADMERPEPMDRLVFGDVGFGKTEVAMRAAFKAVQDGKQVAVLVPTTLLAQQHHATFTERFDPYPVRIEMLSRFLTAKEQREVVAGIAEGAVDIVIGTHRLLADDVRFADLGLLVVDEEQRFGVAAKDRLKELQASVDVLTLTATPIPRTLEMALTGIRDVSHIRTPPEDRHPILTYVGPYDERTVSAAIRRELLREGQVFYVHNRVQSIDHAVARLRDLVPDARYAVAHGRMSEGQLEQVMFDFWAGEYDVLVATTIIESGLDLPSVNTLIVERADRLGLGQLYQLRGRVGRGDRRAYAYLFHPPTERLGEDAYRRLEAIGEFGDLGSGFELARRDLEIRGAGSILSQTQSGHIAAVGFDLYTRLVADAVAELDGAEPAPEPAEVRIDLPGEARLPEDYVADPDGRLEAYRRLAAAADDAAVDDVVAEWTDRYGELPVPARRLVEVARLRVEALRLGIEEIVEARGELRIRPVTLRASEEVRLQRLRRGSVVRGDTMFVPVDPDTGPDDVRAFLRTLWPPEPS